MDETNFQVKSPDRITKIFLSETNGSTIKLEKKGDQWLLNDTMKPVLHRIDLLFEALKTQKASQPVPPERHNLVVKDLASNGVKVELYEGDQKIRSFYVSKNQGPNNSTPMLAINDKGKNATTPYYVKMGILDIFVGIRYSADLKEWRDKKILTFEKGYLRRIVVKYQDSAQFNFNMTLEPDVQVDGNEKVSGKINTERVKQYASFYNNVYCYGFENNYILKDTFIKTFTPFAVIELYSNLGEHQQIAFYYKPLSQKSDNMIKVKGKEYDGDAFLAWLNNRDFIQINAKEVSRLLRAQREFYE